MKAARIHEYGPPEVFRIEKVPRPEVGPRDVLVEVHASSVNPVDWKIRTGSQRAVVRKKLPAILGMDVSGVIVAVGDEVVDLVVGDEVYSSPTHKREGTYAEYVAIDAGEVALKPSSLSHEQAASLPLVALTAWEALVTACRVGEGDKVLVTAGSGGVGTVAIQIAKAAGAYVATTCSGRNAELVRDLGADEVIDYTREDFTERLDGYDAALDSLGGAERRRARSILRRGGRLATIVSNLPEHTARWGAYLGVAVTGFKILGAKIASRFHGVKTSMVVRPPDGGALAEITDLVEQGKLTPVIDSVFPLDEIAAAHEKSQTGRARGKIVISVRS